MGISVEGRVCEESKGEDGGRITTRHASITTEEL